MGVLTILGKKFISHNLEISLMKKKSDGALDAILHLHPWHA